MISHAYLHRKSLKILENIETLNQYNESEQKFINRIDNSSIDRIYAIDNSRSNITRNNAIIQKLKQDYVDTQNRLQQLLKTLKEEK
jgi:lipopolysaccharide export LptBFGC system permease protein LptF